MFNLLFLFNHPHLCPIFFLGSQSIIYLVNFFHVYPSINKWFFIQTIIFTSYGEAVYLLHQIASNGFWHSQISDPDPASANRLQDKWPDIQIRPDAWSNIGNCCSVAHKLSTSLNIWMNLWKEDDMYVGLFHILPEQ